MTNQEAAEMIRNDMKIHHDYLSGQYRKVLGMAIDALLKEQPEIVMCKDCVRRGKVEKCVLAAIAAEKDYPLFMLDNRGEWYCADGERK